MLRSGFRQQCSTSVNATQDFVIPHSVVGEVSSIYKSSNVVFGFASSFTQIIYRGAVVNVIKDQLPALTLPATDGVDGEDRSFQKSFVVARNGWIAQVGRPSVKHGLRLSCAHSFACYSPAHRVTVFSQRSLRNRGRLHMRFHMVIRRTPLSSFVDAPLAAMPSSVKKAMQIDFGWEITAYLSSVEYGSGELFLKGIVFCDG